MSITNLHNLLIFHYLHILECWYLAWYVRYKLRTTTAVSDRYINRILQTIRLFQTILYKVQRVTLPCYAVPGEAQSSYKLARGRKRVEFVSENVFKISAAMTVLRCRDGPKRNLGEGPITKHSTNRFLEHNECALNTSTESRTSAT